jgi:N-acetylneuraminic acid mutarotase
MRSPRKILFTLLVSIALFASGCGGGSLGSSGGGGTTPPSTPSTVNEWTWMSGSDTAGAKGVYGTLGVASSSNFPGARNDSVGWIDTSGNLWLFGGGGNDSTGTNGSLNDLWEYSPTAKEWTWVSGSDTANTNASSGTGGIYGTQGVASVNNLPGARVDSVSWIDNSGNLWLFGGYGFDSTGKGGYLNDLWEFSPTTKEWTWVGGSSTANAPGVYGTKGVAAASNVPGARAGSVSWVDTSGNLWLFSGGSGSSFANDLWEYNPTQKTWTWVSGLNFEESGLYGTRGVASTSNFPGSRQWSVSWIDSSGNFWLFGGNGLDSVTYGVGATVGCLNDLWEFSPTAKTWTWVTGSNLENGSGVYGTQGVAATSNTPGCREGADSWTDSSGSLWLFGGDGNFSSGANGVLNDLWEFSPTTKEWTWIGGSNTSNASGVYGAIGVASSSNAPGARVDSVSWRDNSGNLWLFGGYGFDSTGANGELNDLWRYQP